MRDCGRGGELDAAPPVPPVAVEQPLAAAQEHRHHDDVQLVDQTGSRVLPDGRGAASEPHVEAGGRVGRPLQRRLDPLGDEVERGPAGHGQRWTGMVGEHEDVVVEGRVLTPPATPVRVAVPGAADGAEHVPAHDRGADPLGAAGPEAAVDVGGVGERPVVQPFGAASQWVVPALRPSGGEPVEGQGQVVDAQFGHAVETAARTATHRTSGALARELHGPVHSDVWGS